VDSLTLDAWLGLVDDGIGSRGRPEIAPGAIELGATRVEWTIDVLRISHAGDIVEIGEHVPSRLQLSHTIAPAVERWWWFDRPARDQLHLSFSTSAADAAPLTLRMRADVPSDVQPALEDLPRLDDPDAHVVDTESLRAFAQAAQWHGAHVARAARGPEPDSPALVEADERDDTAKAPPLPIPLWRTLKISLVLAALLSAFLTSVAVDETVQGVQRLEYVEKTCSVDAFAKGSDVYYTLQRPGGPKSRRYWDGDKARPDEAVASLEAKPMQCWVDRADTEPPLHRPEKTVEVIWTGQMVVLALFCLALFVKLQLVATREMRRGRRVYLEGAGRKLSYHPTLVIRVGAAALMLMMAIAWIDTMGVIGALVVGSLAQLLAMGLIALWIADPLRGIP